MVDHAFKEWQLHRVEIRCATGNIRSRAIPERLGFRQEGVTVESEKMLNGQYVDNVIYGILDREWAKNHP